MLILAAMLLGFSPFYDVFKDVQGNSKNNDIIGRNSKSDGQRASREEHSGMS